MKTSGYRCVTTNAMHKEVWISKRGTGCIIACEHDVEVTRAEKVRERKVGA
jgi:hypothetical protein